MPRPGPRPYECVRKAWHSERHNPIRGSLIQEIFRIANEVHSPATRKNREWQETLPIVVLRAEEIMYSKANSEAEYTDLTTLWDRVNDAIDTIIRKDESTETEELLQPCIEAALHLGCTPRRSSRSQRNDSPRCYLRHEISEPSMASDSKVFKNLIPNSTVSLRSSQSSSLISCLKAANDLVQTGNICDVPTKNFPVLSKDLTSRSTGEVRVPSHSASSNTWSIYPLYYDNNETQPDRSKLYSSRPCTNTFPYLKQNYEFGGIQQNTSYSKVAVDSSRPNHEHALNIERGVKCDLTLRLGPVVHSRASVEDSRRPLQVDSSILEGRKLERSLKK